MKYRYMVKIILLGFLIIIILLYCSFCAAYENEVNELSSLMAEKISKSDKKTIAVVDFTDLRGNVTELGRFLAEEFSNAISEAGLGIELIDRTHLKSIIAEHNLSSSGLIDTSTARKLGQIAGVDALVTGTITPFSDTIRLSIKVLDAETARIIGTARGNIAKTQALDELDNLIVYNMVGTNERPNAKIPSTAVKPVESGVFTFTPTGCVRKGDKAECKFSLINNDTETILLRFYARKSFMVDNSGNKYSIMTSIGSGEYYDNSNDCVLMPLVPMKINLLCDGINGDVSSMSLGLSFYDYKYEKNNFITFRDIPFK